MKPEQLSDAIGLVDEPLIEEADRGRRVVRLDRRWRMQWVAIAACLCLTVACVLSLPYLMPKTSLGGVDSTASSSSTPVTVTTTGKRPTVSKAMAVSQAAYPDRCKVSRWNSTSALREGNYTKDFSSYYQKVMTQFLLGSEGENRVFSPANVFVSLAMMAETVDGNSRRQILDLLSVDTMDTLRKQAQLLWEANYEDDQHMTSVLANSLWMNKNLWYKEDLLKDLSKHYYASSFSGEMGDSTYNAMLQNWLNEQTGGILKEQVAGVQMNPSTVLNLVSTIYFGARWVDEFDPLLTEQGVFHAANGDVSCAFMQRADRYLEKVIVGDGYMALSLRLGTYGMYFFLPDEGVSVNEVIKRNNLFDIMHTSLNDDADGGFWEVKLSLPKFDISGDVDLKNGLQKLGVIDIFDSAAADFTPMLVEANGVAVSSIQHSARVTVDEQGCTAAAFTRTDYGMGGPQSNGELDFVLDRPFIFCIGDGYDSVLFAGVVEQP